MVIADAGLKWFSGFRNRIARQTQKGFEFLGEWPRRGIKQKRLCVDSSAKELFWGWFNNHMTVILWAVEHIKARDEQTMLGIRFFLYDIEHHFTDSHASKCVRDAFRYLKVYFKVYPAVKLRQSARAVEMVARIYAGLGLGLKRQTRSIPHNFLSKEREQTQCASCSTI